MEEPVPATGQTAAATGQKGGASSSVAATGQKGAASSSVAATGQRAAATGQAGVGTGRAAAATGQASQAFFCWVAWYGGKGCSLVAYSEIDPKAPTENKHV